MKRRIRFIQIVLAIISLLLTTGCWDRLEIEERGFVVGTAIDPAENGQIKLTFQIAVPTQMKGASGQKNEGGSPYINYSATASTIFKAARKMSNEFSRPPYLAHNQVIIVSDKLAGAKHLGDVLDLFIRDPESRRAASIMISNGKASDILNTNPSIETLPVQYIISTQENPDKSESITPPTNMGELHEFLLSKSSFALTNVTKTENHTINTSGAAIFNGNSQKFKGYLDKEETIGRNMIQGTIKTASIPLMLRGKEIVFEVKEFNRTIKVSEDKRGLPQYDIKISARGNIGESELTDDEILKVLDNELKQAAIKQIKKVTSAVLMKAQKEYKSDFLDLGTKCREQQYELWKQYEENWDHGQNIFSRCNVNVKVDVQIRTIGAIINAK